MRDAVFAVLIIVAGAGSQQALAAMQNAQNLAGLTQYQAPQFPIELRGVMTNDGHVVMALTIDEQGRVSDSIALESSHDAFLKAARDALAAWRFELVVGAVLPRRETIEFKFKRHGEITSLSHAEAAKQGFLSTSTIERKIVQWHELDAEPERIAARMPAVSKAALNKLGGKPLMINFIIDDQGRVRVPVISVADDRELSGQVLEAVRQWRYAPPMYKGRPIAVEVTRSLVLTGTADRNFLPRGE